MSCIENFPNNLAPTYECASELASLGPVAALLTLIIGIPIIKIILRYLKRAFEKYDYIDQGLENFLFRIVSVALWAVVILTAANELGVNVTGIVAALGIGYPNCGQRIGYQCNGNRRGARHCWPGGRLRVAGHDGEHYRRHLPHYRPAVP